jgi:two-component system, LytTR family, response regulator
MSRRLSALVVDDEPLARETLRLLLLRDPEMDVLEAADGAAALELIGTRRPEVLFLDIQMPGLDGFDVLAQAEPGAVQAVVFVTAFERYALQAFDAHAVDYLLKPFDDARFGRALHRAKDKLAHYGPQQAQPAKRLVVRTPGRVLFVNVSDIDWIEAASYYACLHVGSDTHIIRRTLSELERDLGDGSFIRIHRSIIVNLDRIQGLELQRSGEYEVVLKSKDRLRLSRRFRKRLQDRMDAMSASAP